MKWLDDLTEDSARAVARRSSRRSLLGRLAATLVGASALPLLPVERGAAAEPEKADPNAPAADPGDPTTCEYWRYCGIDGFLCSCCGGSHLSCPPGTEPAIVTWIGTCHNPGDGKDYILSYNDCCGKSSCGRCLCNRNEGDTPIYEPFLSNDVNWCVGSKADIAYHCTVSRIVGLAR
jgi:methylamine dehydrogenase light chain